LSLAVSCKKRLDCTVQVVLDFLRGWSSAISKHHAQMDPGFAEIEKLTRRKLRVFDNKHPISCFKS